MITIGTTALVRTALGAALLLAQLLSFTASAQAPAQGKAEAATYVGEQACTTCHALENKHFSVTQHAKIFRLNPRNQRERQVCEACHGPGSIHIKDPANRDALISFSREWGTPIEKQTGACLACHQGGQRLHWPGSIHATNKLGCSDCHNPMARFSANGLLKKPSITETCQTC